MKRKPVVTAALLFINLYIPLSLFSQDFEMNGTVLARYRGNAADVTIPEGVTAIGDKAFWDCNSLTSVTIPSSVSSIGEYAFADCDNLREVTVSRRTTIGPDAFPSAARITYSD